MVRSTKALKPLAVAILALLRERDMHPYEMMRLLRERREDRLVRVQNGTFYHQVSVLERDGLIAEVGTDRDGNRPERTTYTLLPEGDEAVVTWVRAKLASIDNEADIRVAIAEAHNLSRDEVTALLSARRDALQTQLDEATLALEEADAYSVDLQYLADIHRDRALLGADIVWTDAFIDRLQDDEFAWGQPSAAHRAGKERRQ